MSAILPLPLRDAPPITWPPPPLSHASAQQPDFRCLLNLERLRNRRQASAGPSSSDIDHLIRNLDPVRFAREILGFHPDPVQAEFLRSTHPNVIVNCSRHWGKSTTTAALLTHRLCAGPPKSLYLVVSPSLRQSVELMLKIQRFAALAGVPSRAHKPITLHFPNGSRVVGLPASGPTTRGFSAVDMLVFDEAAYIPASLFIALTPTQATVRYPRTILLSTPNGRRGFFYDIWATADRWQKFSIPATDCPRISPQWLEAQRELFGDLHFRQEFLCEFLDTEGQSISSLLLAEAFHPEVEAL